MGSHYRYPGSQPFTDDYSGVFFGREEDIRELSTLVTVENTTVLYGKSGLGKSSLLNAGLLPRVDSERTHLVIPIRLGAASANTTVHPLDIVEEVLEPYMPEKRLLSGVDHIGTTLWEMLKSIAVADPEKRQVLLVFDQFEELFTYEEGVEEFAAALGSVLYNRMPKSMDRALTLAAARNPELLDDETWETLKEPMDVDVLVSIRSDRMSLLERLSGEIPTILHNCYELRPLTREQATIAIEKPAAMEGAFVSEPFAYAPATVDKILEFLTRGGGKSIETFQLQILCEFAEQSVVMARGRQIVEPDDLGDLGAIYRNYYDSCIAKVADGGDERPLRLFVEEGLIFEDEERRVSLFEGQIQGRFGISETQIKRLVDSHLIRAEPHASGGFLYELCHDTLVGPILRAKERRQAEEAASARREAEEREEERRRKKRRRAEWLIGVPLVFATTSMAAYLFVHRNDFDIEGLRGAHPSATYEVQRANAQAESADPPVHRTAITQPVGNARLTLIGREVGLDTLLVSRSDGASWEFPVYITADRRVAVLPKPDTTANNGDTEDVDGETSDSDGSESDGEGSDGGASDLCFTPTCTIEDPGLAAQALAAALDGHSGFMPDSVRLAVPVGSKGENEPKRWRRGLADPQLQSWEGQPDSLESEALEKALVAFGKTLAFSVDTADTRTYWSIPVRLNLANRVSRRGIAAEVGEEVALSLAVNNGEPPPPLPSPDGSLRWHSRPDGTWFVVDETNDTLTRGGVAGSTSQARFAADGSTLLVASTRPNQIQGVPYTIVSYADSNRVVVDVGLDGPDFDTIIEEAGEHLRLERPSWTDTVIGIETSSKAAVVETTRYWWQEITEATRASAVHPVPPGTRGTWEYWIPYAEAFNVPGEAGDGASSTVTALAGTSSTRVEFFDENGGRDTVVTLSPGYQLTRAISAAGTMLRSDRPLVVTYRYSLTDWTTYEDGWLAYGIPPARSLGTKYVVPSDGSDVVVLATRDGTRVEIDGEDVDTTLSRGQSLRLPPHIGAARRIESSEAIMTVVAHYGQYRHEATYATVVPASTDTVFYSAPGSPHHYPDWSDSSRVDVLVGEPDTWVHCGDDSTLVPMPAVFPCRGSESRTIRTSRPATAIFVSDIHGSDTYTEERRRYSYAHPVGGASRLGTQFVLSPFPTSAVEGYEGVLSMFHVLDATGVTLDSLEVEGVVRSVGPFVPNDRGDGGAFLVAVRDAGEDLRVYRVGAPDPTRGDDPDSALVGPTLANTVWSAFTGPDETLVRMGRDKTVEIYDLREEPVDTIRCTLSQDASACQVWRDAGMNEWRAVAVGANERLLGALREDGSAEVWAFACLTDPVCRRMSGPFARQANLLDAADVSDASLEFRDGGRRVLVRASSGEVTTWDLNLELPGRWSFDRVLLWANMPILLILGLLLILAFPALLFELISGGSALDGLRERARSGDRGLRARLGRWLS